MALAAIHEQQLRRGLGKPQQVLQFAERRQWGIALAVVSAVIAAAVALDIAARAAIVGGLIVFGVVFAMNSSLHSDLVLTYSDDEDVATPSPARQRVDQPRRRWLWRLTDRGSGPAEQVE